MTDSDKRKIIESVGLEWHRRIGSNLCSCGFEPEGFARELDMIRHMMNVELDPLDPADMAKIWAAFEDKDEFYDWLICGEHRNKTTPQEFERFAGGRFADTLTDTKKRAAAMLEYFKEKEGE